ncbi:MAG: hypothetical protein ACXQT6_05035 [Candidatus Methanospirareceae archaeon]
MGRYRNSGRIAGLEISLPADWAKFYGLAPGKKVRIIGNSILIVVPADRSDLVKKAREIVERE